jgi:hypothetical protein
LYSGICTAPVSIPLHLFRARNPVEGGAMTSAHQTARLDLQPGNVFALRQRQQGRTLRVISGRVWVTETPARGDRILREGEDFCLEGRYPYVFEALSEASMEVR